MCATAMICTASTTDIRDQDLSPNDSSIFQLCIVQVLSRSRRLCLHCCLVVKYRRRSRIMVKYKNKNSRIFNNGCTNRWTNCTYAITQHKHEYPSRIPRPRARRNTLGRKHKKRNMLPIREDGSWSLIYRCLMSVWSYKM